MSKTKKSKKEKKKKKDKDLKHKSKDKHKLKKAKKEKNCTNKNESKLCEEQGSGSGDMDVPLNLMEKSKGNMTPMTKEEWEKRQSVTRRVYDEATGRHRLIKGDGEVLEEIVSRERHLEINKNATKGDQEYFQSKLLSQFK